jgi:hypothetical protein
VGKPTSVDATSRERECSVQAKRKGRVGHRIRRCVEKARRKVGTPRDHRARLCRLLRRQAANGRDAETVKDRLET